MSSSTAILVIEDDPLIRSGLCHFLEDEGFEVHSAKNGKEGLDILRQQHFSLILLDLQMPVMSGEEFLFALKKEREQGICSVPVLVLTARVEGIQNDDIAGFIRKPLDLDDLLEKIHAICVRA